MRQEWKQFDQQDSNTQLNKKVTRWFAQWRDNTDQGYIEDTEIMTLDETARCMFQQDTMKAELHPLGNMIPWDRNFLCCRQLVSVERHEKCSNTPHHTSSLAY